jgi:hypothetical protein
VLRFCRRHRCQTTSAYRRSYDATIAHPPARKHNIQPCWACPTIHTALLQPYKTMTTHRITLPSLILVCTVQQVLIVIVVILVVVMFGLKSEKISGIYDM